MQTDYNSYGRFEIPNSRYVLGFQYKLSNLTAAKDFYSDKKIYPDIGCDAYSYYALFITLNEKTCTDILPHGFYVAGESCTGQSYGL